jgi:hypothetical protein
LRRGFTRTWPLTPRSHPNLQTFRTIRAGEHRIVLMASGHASGEVVVQVYEG